MLTNKQFLVGVAVGFGVCWFFHHKAPTMAGKTHGIGGGS
jgi:hypothetical protein